MKGDSLFAFVAGAAAGLTLGLLFAPEKGEDTRRKLKETVGDAVLSENVVPLEELLDIAVVNTVAIVVRKNLSKSDRLKPTKP